MPASGLLFTFNLGTTSTFWVVQSTAMFLLTFFSVRTEQTSWANGKPKNLHARHIKSIMKVSLREGGDPFHAFIFWEAKILSSYLIHQKQLPKAKSRCWESQKFSVKIDLALLQLSKSFKQKFLKIKASK